MTIPTLPRAPTGYLRTSVNGARLWAEYDAAWKRYDDFETRRETGYYRWLLRPRLRWCPRCGAACWHKPEGAPAWQAMCRDCMWDITVRHGRSWRFWPFDGSVDSIVAFDLREMAAQRAWQVWDKRFREAVMSDQTKDAIFPEVLRNRRNLLAGRWGVLLDQTAAPDAA